MSTRIRKGDLVQVMAGADRGKQGKVVGVDANRQRLRVEKVRLQKCHLKAGRKGARTGGVIDKEGFIDASNVMLVDPSNGKPDRVRIADGARVFRKSGEAVPELAGS